MSDVALDDAVAARSDAAAHLVQVREPGRHRNREGK